MDYFLDGQRYRGLAPYWKERFQGPVKKIMLVSGCSCPNRNGSDGSGGCIFCSAGGSGEFAGDREQTSKSFYRMTPEMITRQIEKQLSYRGIGSDSDQKVVAYFQAYTNTYGPVAYLEPLFLRAISNEHVCALSIATRPDCLSEEVLDLLSRLLVYKPVMVELGLQTMHERTAIWMRRGYPLSVFEDAVKKLRSRKLEVIVHTIIGLPDESREDMLETMRYLSTQDIQGVKLSLLHVLAGTDLAKEYHSGRYQPLTQEEYISLVADALSWLREDLVIHRLTGDGQEEELLAPQWSTKKTETLNKLRHYMKEHHILQGMNVKEIQGCNDQKGENDD